MNAENFAHPVESFDDEKGKAGGGCHADDATFGGHSLIRKVFPTTSQADRPAD